MLPVYDDAAKREHHESEPHGGKEQRKRFIGEKGAGRGVYKWNASSLPRPLVMRSFFENAATPFAGVIEIFHFDSKSKTNEVTLQKWCAGSIPLFL